VIPAAFDFVVVPKTSVTGTVEAYAASLRSLAPRAADRATR